MVNSSTQVNLSFTYIDYNIINVKIKLNWILYSFKLLN